PCRGTAPGAAVRVPLGGPVAGVATLKKRPGWGELTEVGALGLDDERADAVLVRVAAKEADALAVGGAGAGLVAPADRVCCQACEVASVGGRERVDAVAGGVRVVPALARELGVVR